jgi:hypothetical protein
MKADYDLGVLPSGPPWATPDERSELDDLGVVQERRRVLSIDGTSIEHERVQMVHGCWIGDLFLGNASAKRILALARERHYRGSLDGRILEREYRSSVPRSARSRS